MKRALPCAAAAAAVIAVPVAAAEPQTGVTLYGRLMGGLDQYKATGATAGSAADFRSRYRVYDFTSFLGVKGDEDLGGGLHAVFQIETGVNIDNGNILGQNGSVNPSAGLLASRPSFVGLAGGFGKALFGRQDVWWGTVPILLTGPAWGPGDTPFSVGVNGRVSAGVSRQSNVVSYASPKLPLATNGVIDATLYWSPDTASAGAASSTSNTTAPGGFSNNETAGAAQKTDARLMAATVKGTFLEKKNLMVQYDWVDKKTASDAIAGRRLQNVAHKLAVGLWYTEQAHVSLVVTRIVNKDAITPDAPAGAGDLRQNAMVVNWDHRFAGTRYHVMGQVGWSGKVAGCDAVQTAAVCDNSRSSAFTLGMRYVLAEKRTHLYAFWNQIRNQANAFADFTVAGMTSVATGTAVASKGFDPRVISVGVAHSF